MSKLEGPGLILEALRFAADNYDRRSAKDRRDPVADPIELARILAVEGGISDARTLAAAVLHGGLRGADLETAQLAKAFGKRVASVVAEMAAHKRRGRSKKRKVSTGAKLSKHGQLIELAENIAWLRQIANASPKHLATRVRRGYFDQAKVAVKPLRHGHKRLAKVFDEAYRARP